MARPINEIYNQIIAEKENLTSLGELGYTNSDNETLLEHLNNGSKVSIWRLWSYITAVVIAFHEKLWDLYKAEVEEKLKAMPGTDAWLAQECLKFQKDDTLIFNEDGTYGYSAIDDSKCIIKRVAVSSQFGNSIVKVAAEDEDDETKLSPLDAGEMTAFKEYLNQIQYAGTSVITVTGESDKITLPITVYYNAQVPLSILRTKVEMAVLEYLANLEFDGVFKIIRLIDAIQVLEGVKDVTVNGATAKADMGSPVEIIREYQPVSGYLEVESAEQFPANIEYIIE